MNTFSYDALGNMVERTDDRNGASWQFRYDAFGQLAGGIDSHGHAFALRRADGWTVEHRDLETGASTTYIPGLEPNTAPLAVVSADGRLVYNHAPWGERVMLTTDDRGRVASSYAWSAYGEPSSTSALSSLSPVENGANDLLLLGGQPYFAELGLHRFGQRWYAPGLGRFLSQDPLGFLDGANRYLYAGGQPIDFYDPLGLERQRVQRERSRAFMWALRGEQGLRDWDTSRAWGHELMQRHAGDAEYYRRHGHYPGLNPKASVQILKAMVMFPFAMAALASAPLHFAVALGFGEGASSGTGVVLDYAGVENEVVRALIQDTASVAAGSVAFGAAGRLGRTTVTTAEVAGSAASTEAVAPTAASAAGEGNTTLYRAVSDAEVLSIAEAGGLSPGAGSMGNKWFAESPGDATSWGKWFFKSDRQPIFTLRVDVPNSVAQQMIRVPKLDGIGPARSAQGAVLDAINQQGTFSVLRGNVLP
ncbi:MAG: RHS repeat-associated core domain-containing protein [Deltaproteobacteria bacterium]|nr:RHS repeat-associated core domain-containing protein [Deltaproteobacteria bacterium]